MSGFAFPSKGSAGTAPTTVFFGYVPDRYNMLAAAHPAGNPSSGGFMLSIVMDAPPPSNFVNAWTLYNTNMGGGANHQTVTLGGFTTAPDGTTGTAQKLIESSDAGNILHYVTSGVWSYQYGSNATRLAFFAKAAERTRIAALVGSDNNSGLKVVFDLAGVQVGVAPTLYQANNPPFCVAGPISITQWPNGWCLCMMDVILGGMGGSGSLTVALMLDAGSGTAADATNYTGNGTSGLYVWRSTMLPPEAWGMNNGIVLNNDFNDFSGIDITNSTLPGFNWYLTTGPWPHVGFTTAQGFGVLNPSFLSIASSSITLAPGGIGPQTVIMTATPKPGLPGYVGTLYQAPFLLETRSTVTAPSTQSATQAGASSIWSGSIEWIGSAALNNNLAYEQDFWELNPNGTNDYVPSIGLLNDYDAQGQGFFGGAYQPLGMLPLYDNHHQYGFNASVLSGGVAYTKSGGVPPGTAPPSAPWTLLSPQSTQNYAFYSIDYSQLNTYTVLWTAAPPGGLGHIVKFINNQYCGHFAYNYSTWQLAESAHFIFIIWAGTNTPISADYFRLSK